MINQERIMETWEKITETIQRLPDILKAAVVVLTRKIEQWLKHR